MAAHHPAGQSASLVDHLSNASGAPIRGRFQHIIIRNMMNRIGSLVLAGLVCATAADAHLTKIVIEQRTTAGASETLSGHFLGELDPKDPHNTIITDIEFAPKNARGMVEYSATFALSK